MNCNHAATTFLSLALPPPPSSALFPKRPSAILRPYQTLLSSNTRLGLRVRASNGDSNVQPANWSQWIPAGSFAADKVFRLIPGATASPIGQFVPSPATFLHSIDPRVKLSDFTGMAFRSGCSTGKVTHNYAIWISSVPDFAFNLGSTKEMRGRVQLGFNSPRVFNLSFKDQLGRVYLLSELLFITSGLGSDGVPAIVQLRTPPPAMMGLPNLPVSLTGYAYTIMKLGPLTFTRKGLSVASTVACLTFTVFQSASPCLTATSPEQLAFALRWFMLPLKYIGVSVSEIVLTLLLSLRFISLVFDEVRNIALGIVSRRVNWTQLTVMETIDIFFNYFRRIFKNIFSHAEQITQGHQSNTDCPPDALIIHGAVD
ncbi:Protein ABCI12, chloroplastic isoform B [Glycine soja]|uniref:Protein ABCI12, chloroplastic isoform B n=1 Tax=Glycine soja TaxID=3848 RepID=A0A445I7Z0_GLYSO|nr:Protein ABCI12, chloroplastic isoform B [Glycine soja]